MTAEPAGLARPRRWDVPFGPEMTEEDVDRVLLLPPFDAIDPFGFLPTLPLRGILRNDCRLRSFEAGDLVVRRGDYGNSAFYVVSGAVRVVLGDGVRGLPAAVLGRAEPRHRTWRSALRQLWGNPQEPEVRDLRDQASDARLGTRGGATGTGLRVFLQDVPGVLDRHETARLEAGEFFGELAALGRSPRTATVFAEGPAELLEIRWQGLRDIRRRAPQIKQHIDQLYRERSLQSQLRETPLFRGLSPEELAVVAASTSFESHGDFDWQASYKALAERGTAAGLAGEPVIAEEGHYPNGLLIVRAGFARLTERHHNGQRTVSYLGKGQTYGLEELAHNWRSGEQVALRRGLRAVGYVDVLVVPTSVLERLVLPRVPAELLPALPGVAEPGPPAPEAVPQDLLEFLAERRFINGTAAMLIDLDRCTRCDDCVRACAATHDGNPRFLRQGPRHGSHQVAHACMHCVDPVCMIGCPTGAIHRSEAQGQVLINDRTCIGCSTCAQSCPYENIRMVEIRDPQGRPALDSTTHQAILKATKCDLCVEQLGGPACERACPHDALARLDLQDLPGLARWLER